jgi:metallo-beta-lactamase class B
MRILISALLVCGMASAQGNSTWRNPYPAHRIAGNLYYVGTEDLACYLIATPAGHILINTGLEDSTPLLRTSLQQVGLKLEDVKILLTMQAHFDHVAAMAEAERGSGLRY